MSKQHPQKQREKILEHVPDDRDISMLALRVRTRICLGDVVDRVLEMAAEKVIRLQKVGSSRKSWRVSLGAPVKVEPKKPTFKDHPVTQPAKARGGGSFWPETSQGAGEIIALKTIDPETAAEALSNSEQSFKNRRLSNAHVDRLARAIISNDWRVTGDTIKFDPDRVCYDGQHRLWAIVTADIPAAVYCLFNGNRDHALYLDQGRTRSFRDHLEMRGEKNSQSLAATVALVVRYELGTLHTKTPYSAAELNARFLKDADAFRDSLHAAYKARSIPGATGTHFSAISFLAGNSPTFLDFCDEVRRPADLPRGNPAGTLARRLDMRSQKRGYMVPPLIRLALTVKAWNAWLAGRNMPVLRWARFGQGSEEFPRVEVPEQG